MGKRIYTLLNKLVMVLSFDSLRKKSVGIILILRLVSVCGTNFSQICMSEKKNLLGTIQPIRCLEIGYQQQFLQNIKKRSQPVEIWQVSRIMFSTEMQSACYVIASSSHFLPKFFTDVEERGTVGNECLVIPWCFLTFVYNQLYMVKVCFFYFYAFHDNTERKILFFYYPQVNVTLAFMWMGFITLLMVEFCSFFKFMYWIQLVHRTHLPLNCPLTSKHRDRKVIDKLIG